MLFSVLFSSLLAVGAQQEFLSVTSDSHSSTLWMLSDGKPTKLAEAAGMPPMGVSAPVTFGDMVYWVVDDKLAITDVASGDTTMTPLKAPVANLGYNFNQSKLFGISDDAATNKVSLVDIDTMTGDVTAVVTLNGTQSLTSAYYSHAMNHYCAITRDDAGKQSMTYFDTLAGEVHAMNPVDDNLEIISVAINFGTHNTYAEVLANGTHAVAVVHMSGLFQEIVAELPDYAITRGTAAVVDIKSNTFVTAMQTTKDPSSSEDVLVSVDLDTGMMTTMAEDVVLLGLAVPVMQ